MEKAGHRPWELFTIPLSEKLLDNGTYKEFLQLKKTKHQIRNWAKDLNKHFTKDYTNGQ